MANVMGSGTSARKGGVAALRQALGLNNIVPSTARTSPLQRAIETGGGTTYSSPGRSISWPTQSYSSGWSYSSGGSYDYPDYGGGGSYDYYEEPYVVPSVSPMQMPAMIRKPTNVGVTKDKDEADKPQGLVSSTVPVGLASAGGWKTQIAPTTSIDKPHLHDAALDVWERQAAQREGRDVRNANLFGEEYDMGGSPLSKFLGSFDNQLDMIGNTPMNDVYLRDAVDRGLISMDDAYAVSHRPQSIEEEKEMHKAHPKISADVYKNLGKVVDDGSKYDYAHMTSDSMLGEQYLHYRDDLGMGGRTGYIDPNGIYSKRDENRLHGFTPYTPDNTTYLNAVGESLLKIPSKLGDSIANLRETLTPDYMIHYGNGNSVSGRDFDKLANPFLSLFDRDLRKNPEKFLRRPADENYTALVKEYAVPDASGQETYHYGNLSNVWDEGNGTYLLEFTDGSDVVVGQDYIDQVTDASGGITIPSTFVSERDARGQLPENLDALNDVEWILQSANEYGGNVTDYADVLYLPDMVLSDGTRMMLDDVDRIMRDESPEDDEDNELDDDITYDFTSFGPFDNKPARLMNQEPFRIGENGGIEFDPTDLADNAVDWTLGSLPISLGRFFPWAYSLSSAIPAVKGIDPSSYRAHGGDYGNYNAGYYDDDGNLRYGVTDENGNVDEQLSDETRWWNAAGNALVPLTEMMVGPVGETIVPLEKIFGELPSAPTAGQVMRNALIGAIGEGVEEDLGNIFDDWTQYGWQGLFANPKKDENGDIMYDAVGHEIRDYDTPVLSRLANFANPADLANSFLGGAVVDALMQGVPVSGQLRSALQGDAARRKTGVRQFVDPDMNREPVYLSPEYLSQFSAEV